MADDDKYHLHSDEADHAHLNAGISISLSELILQRQTAGGSKACENVTMGGGAQSSVGQMLHGQSCRPPDITSGVLTTARAARSVTVRAGCLQRQQDREKFSVFLVPVCWFTSSSLQPPSPFIFTYFTYFLFFCCCHKSRT